VTRLAAVAVPAYITVVAAAAAKRVRVFIV